jgi:MoxR-like ATPase
MTDPTTHVTPEAGPDPVAEPATQPAAAGAATARPGEQPGASRDVAPPPQPPTHPDLHPADPRAALGAVRAEIAKAVVGQDAVVTGLVIGLLCRGHVLLEGVPGVAKTLLVRALAAALDLQFSRVQFTPDLMPGDVTGSLVYEAHSGGLTFAPGPVFTNLMLADEINRTPPKTQSALLEAMQERQVTVDGVSRPLPDPFVVVATQNPIEYEGTYPLPEAQLDRFLLHLTVPLPGRADEVDVVARHAAGFDPGDLAAAGLRPVARAEDLRAAREQLGAVTVAPEVLGYVVDVCRATRSSPSLSLGVSPRGATALLATARAWAWLCGRDFVTPDDVKALTRPTLRHRVALRPEAELEGVTPDTVLGGVLDTVPAPR